jgi:hypothetical protein
MVALYVAGEKVGTLADAETLIPELIARNQRVEFRDEAGNSIGTLHPTPPPGPDEPLVPWDPSITQADIDRVLAEPGFTFDEVKKRLGWK